MSNNDKDNKNDNNGSAQYNVHPVHCRERLQAEGKPYPRSGCVACATVGLNLRCPHGQFVVSEQTTKQSTETAKTQHQAPVMQEAAVNDKMILPPAMSNVKLLDLGAMFADAETMERLFKFLENPDMGYQFNNAGTLVNKWDVVQFCIAEMLFDDNILRQLGETDHCIVWA